MTLTATDLFGGAQPTYRELCSGYGGLGLAVERVTGGRIVDHAETDLRAARVHDAHWPGVPNLGDITATRWEDLEPTDILCAGFPCQPISQAGRRKVTNDARWLWPHIAHAVRVLRPRLVVLENVPPLLRPWRDDDGWWNPAPIEEVAGDLAEAGYDCRWTSVRAADIGAPHLRERVFVAAVHADHVGREGGQPRALGDTRRGHHPAPDSRRAGAGRDDRAVPGTPPSTRRARLDVHAAVDDRPAPADTGSAGRWRAWNAETGDRPATHVRRGQTEPGGRGGAATDSGGCGLEAGPRFEDVDAERIVRPGADVDRLGVLAWGIYSPAIQRWERLTRPAPAAVDDRGRLAPEFSEWMMGLPAGWVTDTGISRTAQLHVIGNGVVPQAAAHALTDLLETWIVSRIAEALEASA